MKVLVLLFVGLVMCAGCGCGCGVSGDMVGTWICESQADSSIVFKSDKTYVYVSHLPKFRQDYNVVITYEGDWRGGGDDIRMTPRKITTQNMSPENDAEVQRGVGKEIQWAIRWEDKEKEKWTATDSAVGSFHRSK